MPFEHLVVLGASAGGVEAVSAVASRLEPDFPAPICVVVHTSPDFPACSRRCSRAPGSCPPGIAPRLGLPIPAVSHAHRPGQPQAPETVADGRRRERLAAAEVHLLEQYAPPSLVVNEGHDLVHLSERAGRYLGFAGGEPSHDLLKVVRPELRLAGCCRSSRRPSDDGVRSRQ